ncbi:MAG: redoxin family protein [Bacteroidota bacterium]
MKLILTLQCLLLITPNFAQKTFPDDFRKGGVEIGTPIPDFSLYSLDSTVLSTSDLSNKVTFINYWFVGCNGCLQEEGFLKEIAHYFSDNEDVQLISITTSEPIEVNGHLEKHGGFGFPIYTVDGFKEARKLFKVRSFPHNQLVVNGTVVENLTVPIAREEMKQWLIDKIEEELRALR